MIIEFEKLIKFHAEVDEDYFKNEFGEIDTNVIIGFCENNDSPNDNCWIYNDEIKNISWKTKDDYSFLTEDEYKKIIEERENSERCYECTGYGDDYDYDGNCNCETCPFNDTYIEPIEIKTINRYSFIKEFCNKIKEFYKNTKTDDEIIKLLNDTKFSYMQISANNRIFLFAENPTIFIKDNNLWNYLQNWVNETYDTFIAIGLTILNKDMSELIPIFDIADYICGGNNDKVQMFNKGHEINKC